ncbi:MAG: hypothetical protein B7733_23645 [Myxococcales bacterium FL481]|nr:MAG: hypothetical protein B7733_23645 [Myxococcales bacterium FL481]
MNAWAPIARVAGLALLSCAPGRERAIQFEDVHACRPVFSELWSPIPVAGDVRAVVADAEENRGGAWVLSTGPAAAGADGMVVHRLPGPIDETTLPPDPLGLEATAETRVSFTPGPRDGQAWLLVQQPDSTTAAFVYERGVGRVASNDALHRSSAPPAMAAPDGWIRHLIFVAGRPYLLSAPKGGQGPQLRLHLVRLSSQLAALASFDLVFDPYPETEWSDWSDSVLEQLQVVPFTDFPRAKTTDIILQEKRTFTFDRNGLGEGSEPAHARDEPSEQTKEYAHGSVLLRLRVAERRLEAAWHVVSSHRQWDADSQIGEADLAPPTVARDEFTTFVFEPNPWGGLYAIQHADPARRRFLHPDPTHASVVQLPQAAAILTLTANGADLLPLIDLPDRGSDPWHDPDQEAALLQMTPHPILSEASLQRIQPGGRGHLVAFRHDGSATLGEIACAPRE